MKQLRWYIALIGLLLAGDRLGGLFLHRKVMESQFRYSRLYSRNAWADILLLGNSRGLMFYQPYLEEITGKSTCNLSYNGLPMDAAKCLTLDYLQLWHPDPSANKRLLLLDITICDRENDELLAGFLAYSDRSEQLDHLIRHKLPKVWWGGQVSHLFRYNNELFQRALYHQHRTDKDWLLDREISAALAKEVAKHSYDLEIRPYLIQQLKETVTAAQADGMEVRLLIGPYFPGFQVKNLDSLKTAVENAIGLKVHDYRSALTESADFGDFMHPNKQGSIKYLALLKADGILP